MKTPDAEVKDAVVRLVFALNKLIESCESAVDKYSEFSGIDDDLLSMVSETIDEAEIWKDKAELLYKTAEIYDTNSGSRLDIVVKPFSGTGEQTIYSFLRDFENSFRGQGNDAKKSYQALQSFFVKQSQVSGKQNVKKLFGFEGKAH